MSEAVFDSIQAALSADSKLGPKVGGSIQFVLSGGHGGDSTWVIDCKQSKVSRGAGKADCTVTLSDENFLALASGKLQGMQAFMSGKMKIKGNMMLAQKVGLTHSSHSHSPSPEPPPEPRPARAAPQGREAARRPRGRRRREARGGGGGGSGSRIGCVVA